MKKILLLCLVAWQICLSAAALTLDQAKTSFQTQVTKEMEPVLASYSAKTGDNWNIYQVKIKKDGDKNVTAIAAARASYLTPVYKTDTAKFDRGLWQGLAEVVKNAPPAGERWFKVISAKPQAATTVYQNANQGSTYTGLLEVTRTNKFYELGRLKAKNTQSPLVKMIKDHYKLYYDYNQGRWVPFKREAQVKLEGQAWEKVERPGVLQPYFTYRNYYLTELAL